MESITDSERLSKVINALGESANSMSIKLRYSSPGSIYHVVNGINQLSKGMIDRIVNTFPNVSYQFLKDGVGGPLLSGEELQAQMNIFNTAGEDPEIKVMKKLLSIPDKLDKIIELLEDKKI